MQNSKILSKKINSFSILRPRTLSAVSLIYVELEFFGMLPREGECLQLWLGLHRGTQSTERCSRRLCTTCSLFRLSAKLLFRVCFSAGRMARSASGIGLRIRHFLETPLVWTLGSCMVWSLEVFGLASTGAALGLWVPSRRDLRCCSSWACRRLAFHSWRMTTSHC